MANILDDIRQYGTNAKINIKTSFERLTPTQMLRLVVLVCAYMLFRRYVLAHAARRQQLAYEQEAAAAGNAQLSPNDLRGVPGGSGAGGARGKPTSALENEAKMFKYPGIPYDTDDEDEDATQNGRTAASGAATGQDVQWGKKATRRQRKALRMLLDAEEKRLKERIGDDEDKDIEEFLVDGESK